MDSIGRLDFNTCGLLIFTTSGELANRMMHPRFEIEREYAVRVMGQLQPQHLQRLTQGIELEDGVARCESVELRGGEGANQWCHVVLKEGRNRIVRRLFEKLGFTVSRLMRVRFGELPPRVKRGQSYELSADETRRLLDWLAAAPQPAALPCAGQIAAPQHKHAVIAAAGLRPDERQMRECRFKPPAMVPDFNHQQPLVVQMRGRLVQDDSHRVQTVLAAGERQARLMAVFARQLAHDAGADIGRIGDDQVIALATQR